MAEEAVHRLLLAVIVDCAAFGIQRDTRSQKHGREFVKWQAESRAQIGRVRSHKAIEQPASIVQVLDIEHRKIPCTSTTGHVIEDQFGRVRLKPTGEFIGDLRIP
jgi:hypothetical protein